MSDELRLMYTVILNGLLFAAALVFVRRKIGGDLLCRITDALLLCFAAQYAMVGVSGIFGVLSFASLAVLTIGVSAIPFFLAKSAAEPPQAKNTPWETLAVLAVAIFTVIYGLDIAWQSRLMPVVASDAMTYHLPTAVQWLQTGRLGYYPNWYYNPANTYSPLAGSMFMAWLLAPMGNDVLVRFVELGPWLLIFFAMIQMGRELGAGDVCTVLLACSAVMLRSFVGETILQKDDLFLAAFFACLVAALSLRKLQDPLGPWRVGIALGLLLATKYTVAFSLPMLLLAIDAPFVAKWKWRQWGIAVGCAALLAGPWYVRNWMVMGNPLFPITLSLGKIVIFHGLFSTHATAVLRSFAGGRHTLIGGFYGVPAVMAVMLAATWLAAWWPARRQLARQPLVRLCLLGPVVSIALFIWLSPYAEIRFIYPAILLLFGAAAITLASLRPAWIIWLFGLVMLIVAVMTGFVSKARDQSLAQTIPATLAIMGIYLAQRRRFRFGNRVLGIMALAILAVAAWCVHVYWPVFLEDRNECQGPMRLHSGHGAIALAWDFIERQLPPDATVAYANTYFTYPLYDSHFRRRVVHVSSNPALEDFRDLPAFARAVDFADILPTMLQIQTANPDGGIWLRRLRQSGAAYLFIAKALPYDSTRLAHPPELEFAQTNPDIFRVIEIPCRADEPNPNDVCTLYAIHWPR